MSNATHRYSKGIKNSMMRKYIENKREIKKGVMADLMRMKFSQKLAFCIALLTKRKIK